jgi:hypothetical protein
MSEIAIFESDTGIVTVRMQGDTVWLRQEQLAELFGRERSVITKHLGNVFKEGELARESVCAKFAHTAQDGKTYEVDHFNLDAILSVGYRVNSKQGTRFRQWANRTSNPGSVWPINRGMYLKTPDALRCTSLTQSGQVAAVCSDLICGPRMAETFLDALDPAMSSSARLPTS